MDFEGDIEDRRGELLEFLFQYLIPVLPAMLFTRNSAPLVLFQRGDAAPLLEEDELENGECGFLPLVVRRGEKFQASAALLAVPVVLCVDPLISVFSSLVETII